MSARNSKHVRHFLRASRIRLEEAHLLLEFGYSLGAVYLAGYSTEFHLKSLILSQLPEHKQIPEIHSFRGRLAHDFGWLRNRYLSLGGTQFPRSVIQLLTTLNDWDTDLRYLPSMKYNGNAAEFIAAVRGVVKFVEQRI